VCGVARRPPQPCDCKGAEETQVETDKEAEEEIDQDTGRLSEVRPYVPVRTLFFPITYVQCARFIPEGDVRSLLDVKHIAA